MNYDNERPVSAAFGDEYESCTTENAEENVFDRRSAKKAFNRISLAVFVISLLLIVLALSVGFLIPREYVEAPWFGYAFNFLAMYVIAFPIGYFIIKTMPKDTPDSTMPNTMTVPMFVRLFISALCLMYVGNIIGVIFDTVFASAKYFMRERPIETFAENLGLDAVWLQILFVAVFAPIFEELIFRKLIIDRTKRFGYAPAIIFSGVLFGIFHGNFGQAFYATMLGFLLGYIYVRTGKIVNTILMHAAVNIYGGVIPILIFSLMDVDRLDEIMSITDYDVYFSSLIEFLGENILPIMLYALHATVFFTLAIVGLVFLIKDRKRYKAGLVKADPPMPKKSAFSTMFVSAGFILFLIVMAVEFYISL